MGFFSRSRKAPAGDGPAEPGVSPFADPYYDAARRREETLLRAPARGALLGLEVVDTMRGGMGEISVVRKPSADAKPVLAVVKSVPAEYAGSPHAMAQIADEALTMSRVMSRIRAPFCVAIKNVHRPGVDGTLYLELPFYPGGSLRDRIRGGPVPFPELAHHVLAIGLSLASLHHAGFLHRDLKPANVLLGVEDLGGFWMTELADFGLTTLWSARARAGGFAGTVLYASPEQLRGASPSPPMDVWAWAVIACELARGCHPYEALVTSSSGEPDAVAAGLAGVDATRFTEGLDGLPPRWIEVLTSCLAVDPAGRPDMTTALNALAETVAFAGHGGRCGTDLARALVTIDDVLLQTSFAMPQHPGIRALRMPAGEDAVVMRMGWPDVVKRAELLQTLGSAAALWDAVEAVDGVLGRWNDPRSVLGQFMRRPDDRSYEMPPAAEPNVTIAMTKVPAEVVLDLLERRCRALVDLAEAGAAEAVRELRDTVRPWAATGVVQAPSERAAAAQGGLPPGEFRLNLIAQGETLAGDFDRAEAIIAAGLEVNPGSLALRGVAIFAAMARQRYDEALRLAIGLANDTVSTSRASALGYLLQALKIAVESGRFDRCEEFLDILPSGQHVEIEACRTVWMARRGTLTDDQRARCHRMLRAVSRPGARRARVLVDAAWHLGDRPLAVAFARSALADPCTHLPHLDYYVPFFESVLAGVLPEPTA